MRVLEELTQFHNICIVHLIPNSKGGNRKEKVEHHDHLTDTEVERDRRVIT